MTSAAPTTAITTNDLQQAMAMMLQQQQRPRSSVSLTNMLTNMDNIGGDLFQDDGVAQQLLPLLPPTRQMMEELKDTVSCLSCCLFWFTDTDSRNPRSCRLHFDKDFSHYKEL